MLQSANNHGRRPIGFQAKRLPFDYSRAFEVGFKLRANENIARWPAASFKNPVGPNQASSDGLRHAVTHITTLLGQFRPDLMVSAVLQPFIPLVRSAAISKAVRRSCPGCDGAVMCAALVKTTSHYPATATGREQVAGLELTFGSFDRVPSWAGSGPRRLCRSMPAANTRLMQRCNLSMWRCLQAISRLIGCHW